MRVSLETDCCPKFNDDPGFINYKEFPKYPDIQGYEPIREDGMLDLSSVEGGDLEQYYTRAERDDKRIDDLEDWMKRDGFITNVEPPILDENDNIIEGRGRIEAAIKRGEKWIPVFRYKAINPSEGAAYVAATIANNPRSDNSKVPNTMEDFALTFRKLVELGPERGGIEDTSAAVTNKLNEINWTQRWTRTATRTTLRIMIDNFIAAARKGDSVVNVNESDVKAWYKTNIILAGKTNHILISADQMRYPKQIIMKDVFDSVEKGTDPLNIILYTKRINSQDAIANVKAFVKEFNKMYDSIYTHVDVWKRKDEKLNDSFGPAAYSIPSKRPYRFVGCVPQIIDYHNIEGNKLVPIKDYGKKLNVRKNPSPYPEIDNALGVKLNEAA